MSSVDRPVNVLLMPGIVPIEELAEAGVAPISVGGAFSAVAFGALARAARELKEHGTYGFFELAQEGRELTTRAFRLHQREKRRQVGVMRVTLSWLVDVVPLPFPSAPLR